LVQAAVDAAGNRDTVDIAAGTYVESVWIPPRKGSISIKGAGAGETIINAANPSGYALAVSGGGTRATISDLTLTGGRNGAFVWDSAQALFTEVELTGNQFGLESRGKTTVTSSNVVGNDDDGIWTESRGSSLTVLYSTVSGNGINGIRIGAESKAKIVTSTISGNGGFGIGIGPATVEASTITDNGGGNYVYRRTTLRTSIVAGNDAFGGDCETQGAAQLRVLAPTLIGDVGSCTLVGPAGAVLTGDPMLGPLQNNGLSTETHALLPGSPAIGVLTRKAQCRTSDQRGLMRSVPCDLGAYEAP
jgi:hypothetical protein